MKRCSPLILAALTAVAISASAAQAQVQVVYGTSWDGPSYTLQSIVDAVYGPGQIDVATDYIGHDAGEVDPWFWVGQNFSALIVREIAGNQGANLLGWYKETDVMPVIDGVNDGVVFEGPEGPGATRVVTFDGPVIKFGFYLDPNGPDAGFNAPQPELFFSNRRYNDLGADGGGADHEPFDGDIQALVFDISALTQRPNTWLVAFEDCDSGPNPKGPYIDTDNDFNDFVFEVEALGATPVAPVSLGQVKARWR